MQISTEVSAAFSPSDHSPSADNVGMPPDLAINLRTKGYASSLRRSRSYSDHDALGRDAPTLTTLIGKESARRLDAYFGSLQPPYADKSGATFHPWELDEKGVLRTHPRLALLGDVHGFFSKDVSVERQHAALESVVDLAALMADTKRYIWVVGRTGRVVIGESVGAPGPNTSTDGGITTPAMLAYSGHPMLVKGAAARVAGELHYDREHHRLVVYDRSGRYSQYIDRGPAQIDHVANTLKSVFAIDGLDVVSRKKIARRPLKPLAYPNLTLPGCVVAKPAPPRILARGRSYSCNDVFTGANGHRETAAE